MCFIASYDEAAEANLVLNGSFIVGIRATTSGTTIRHGAAGNSAILQLVQGDKVWVEHTGGNVLWTSSYALLTTFSGFQLRKNCNMQFQI